MDLVCQTEEDASNEDKAYEFLMPNAVHNSRTVHGTICKGQVQNWSLI